MTDNVTNLLLAQRLMARLHPPETGGWPAREPPDWALTLEAQLRRERERRLGEQTRWNYWQDRIREQQGWMEPYRQLISRPEQAAGTFESEWPSNLTQRPLPAWATVGTEQQRQIDFLRSLEQRPQWEVPPLPHYDIPAPDYRPLNQPITAPVPYLTPSGWPPSR